MQRHLPAFGFVFGGEKRAKPLGVAVLLERRLGELVCQR